jgi:hypothetical protein
MYTIEATECQESTFEETITASLSLSLSLSHTHTHTHTHTIHYHFPVYSMLYNVFSSLHKARVTKHNPHLN